MAISPRIPGAMKNLRVILSEWKKKADIPLKEQYNRNFLIELYRDNVVTQKKFCRGPKEMEHLADTYATYLSSTRKAVELTAEYHGKGERSVEESGHLVGLQIPRNPFEKSSTD